VKTDNLHWLEKWYRMNTNGDWEHQHGIKIGTVDNPGWRADIDIAETPLSAKPFVRVEIERNDSDWIRCWVEEGKFKIACGSLNLTEGLEIFRSWTES
jgi:hypothetical protein